MAAPVTIYGIISDLLSSITRKPDNSDPNAGGIPIRLSARGEQFGLNLFNGLEGLVQEGSLWIASTATPGTGIALTPTTGTTFSDTQALIVLNNTDTVGPQGKTIYPLFATLIVTTAPTSQTLGFVGHRIDSVPRGTAGTLLGATLTAAKPSNMSIGGNSVGQCYALGASAVSVAASANVRNVGRNIYRGQIPVVGDHITIAFGCREMAAGGVNLAATTASGITVFAPGIAIGPQQSYVMNEWATARAAAMSGELVVGWIER